MLQKSYQPPSTKQICQHQYPHLYCRYPIDNMTQLEVTNDGISFIIKQFDAKDQNILLCHRQLKYQQNQDGCFGTWNKLYLQNLMRIGALKNDIIKNKGYEEDKSVRNRLGVINKNPFNVSALPLIKQVKNRSKSTYQIYCRECDKKYKKMYPFSYQNILQFHQFLPQKDINNLFKIILLKLANIFQQLTSLSQINNTITQKKKNQQDFNVYILKCQCQYLFPLIISSDRLNPESMNPNNQGCQQYWQIVYQIIKKFSLQLTPLQKQINILLQKINDQKINNLDDHQFLIVIRSLIQEMGNKSDKKYESNIKYTQQTHNTKQQDSNGTNTSKTICQSIKQDLHIKMILSSDRKYHQSYDLNRNARIVDNYSNNNNNRHNNKKIRQYLSERIPLPTFTHDFSLSNFVLEHKKSINQPDGQYYSINSVSCRPFEQKKQKTIPQTEQKVRKKKSSRNQIDTQLKQKKNSIRLSSSPINGIKQIRNKIKKYNSKFLHKQKQNKKVVSQSIKKAQITKTKQKNVVYSQSIPWQQILEVSKFIHQKYTKKQNPSECIQSQDNSIKKDDRITRDSITNIQQIKFYQKIERQVNKQQKLNSMHNFKIQNGEECTSVLLMIDQQILKKIDPIVQHINEIRQLGKKYKMMSILQIYLLYKKFFYMRTALLQNLTSGQEYGYTLQKWSQIKQNKKIGEKIKEIQSQNKQILVNLQKMHKKVQKQIQQNKGYAVVDPSIIKIQIQNQSAYEQFIYKMLQTNISRFKYLCQILEQHKNSQAEGERLILQRYGISILLASVDQLSDENYQEQILTWLTSYNKIVSLINRENYIGQIQQILKKIRQNFGISQGNEVQISDY